MALDLTIKGALPNALRHGLSFDDDGYYWFMHPWFESLAKQTGKYIDLYGRVEFSPSEFPRLRDITAEVRERIRQQPTSWQVTTGWQTHPLRKEITKKVNRSDFLRLLDAFDRLMDTASSTGESIECIED